MPYNGSGTFNLIYNWQNDAAQGLNISSSRMQGQDTDMAAGLSLCLTKDGQQVPTGNLPMGGFRHTNVANAQNRTDYAAAGQVQDSSMQWLTAVAGADTITATLAVPSLTAYTAGQTFRFLSVGANTTTAPTLNINSIGAKTITKNGTTPLVPGDIPTLSVVTLTYDGTQFQMTSQPRQGILIAVTPFNSSGTFNSNPATKFVITEQGAGGGGGGGAAAAGAAQIAPAQGGGSGSYARVLHTSGFSGGIPVTIGAGGNGGAAGANNGSNGGQTTFGTLVTTPGGIGGQGASAQSAPFLFGSANGSATPTTTGTALLLSPGQSGSPGIGMVPGNSFNGGAGAPSYFGGGAPTNPVTGSVPAAAVSKSSGGAGAVASNSGAVAGSRGADGVLLAYEYA